MKFVLSNLPNGYEVMAEDHPSGLVEVSGLPAAARATAAAAFEESLAEAKEFEDIDD